MTTLQQQLAGITNAGEAISFIEKEKSNIEAKQVYENLHATLKKDKEVLHFLLANYQPSKINVFEQLDDEIRKDKSFILEYFEKVKRDLGEADKALKNDPEIPELAEAQKKANTAAGYAPYILKGMHESLINDEDILRAALTIKYVSVIEQLDPKTWNMDKEWAVKVARYNIQTVHYLPKSFKRSIEVCKALLDVNLGAFNFFDDEMKRNKFIQEHALSKDGLVFQIFPEDLKKNKQYIKSMLQKCPVDQGDQRGYMVWGADASLNSDQELINLAIERNPEIFQRVYPAEQYSKKLFTYFLKVTPRVYKFVPENMKDDKDLFISLLRGEFDGPMRESIFKSSKWYDDPEFAVELIQKSSSASSYSYLKDELKVDDRVLDAFLKKYPEPHHVKLLPAKQLGKDWFRPLIKNNTDVVFYINDEQIAEAYFEGLGDEVLEKAKLSDLSWYGPSTGLRRNPMVVRSLMENPLVSAKELEQAIEFFESDEEIVKSAEYLLEHLRKPFFVNRFYWDQSKFLNEEFGWDEDQNEMTYGEKCGERARYIKKSLKPSDLSVLKVLLGDPHGTVRKNAAQIIKLSSRDILAMFEEGIPVVNKNEQGKPVIKKQQDYFLLKGLIENAAIKGLDEQKVSELKEALEDARKNARYTHVRLEGWGSEVVQGIISGDEYKSFLKYRDESDMLSDDMAWLRFAEEAGEIRNNDKGQSGFGDYRDYNEVCHFSGLGLSKIFRISVESFKAGDSDGPTIYEWNSDFLRNKIEDWEDIEFREGKYGTDMSKLGKIDHLDQLVTYLDNDNRVIEFIIPDIEVFDPDKFHFIGVDTDDFGLGGFFGYGRYVVGIVYDGVEYYEADNQDQMGDVDSYGEIHFDELKEIAKD